MKTRLIPADRRCLNCWSMAPRLSRHPDPNPVGFDPGAGNQFCPCCCLRFPGDTWYDCQCEQGGKPGCPCCCLVGMDRFVAIVSVLHAVGWCVRPSEGMRDYLTPGWRKTSCRTCLRYHFSTDPCPKPRDLFWPTGDDDIPI